LDGWPKFPEKMQVRSQLTMQGWRYARRLLALQCVFVVLLALIMGLAQSALSSFVAALLGGCISILGNLLLAYLTFRYSGARAAASSVSSFYLGEFGKTLLTLLLLTVVMTSGFFSEIALLSGFAAAIVAQILAPLVMQK
jgi:ATP synthase protein I